MPNTYTNMLICKIREFNKKFRSANYRIKYMR